MLSEAYIFLVCAVYARARVGTKTEKPLMRNWRHLVWVRMCVTMCCMNLQVMGFASTGIWLYCKSVVSELANIEYEGEV